MGIRMLEVYGDTQVEVYVEVYVVNAYGGIWGILMLEVYGVYPG